MQNFRKGKSGRRELRQITKVGKKRSRTEEPEETAVTEISNDDQSSYSDNEVEEDVSKRREEVYGALLTLLKSENPSERNKKTKLNATVDETDATNTAEADPENQEESIENGLEDKVDDFVSDEEQLSELDESEDESDAFESHFNNYDEKLLNQIANGLKNKTLKYKSIRTELSEDESCIFSRPCLGDEKISPLSGKQALGSYFIKQKLKLANDIDGQENKLTTVQRKLVDPMFQYKDILYEYASYSEEEEYRDLYSLHVLNHIYKTRDRILKNNQRLQEDNDQEFLDQGFTRPKILIVVPTRDAAYQVVKKIMDKSGLDQFDKKSKFDDQFYEDSLPPGGKPKSFQHIFKGNANDFFVLGLKFTRKTLRLYSNFYQSDIIICSPLGIQLILENTDKKKRQNDFLSSIELFIVDQLHSIEYQNMSHVTTIFEHINKIPEQQRDADFSRIRMWYINEQARLFRQTMIFTKYISPFANALLKGKCQNICGRWRNHRKVDAQKSSIGQLGLKVRQIFQRFDLVGASSLDEPDLRFKFFTSVVVPTIVKSTGYEDGILLYIPEYTDFVRVRNYLREKTSIMFGDINEYSDQRHLTSNRAKFQSGKIKILLYTERLHHFRRYEIKNVKSLIFYKPPTNPEFYQELVRFIGKNVFLGNCDINISTVRCIYSKLDSLALERIVGSKRAAVLTHAQNEVYEFK